MAGTKTAPQEQGSKVLLPPCRVCGDRAAGFHYGVNTCEACKGFFHRSLRRHKEYKCRANRSTGYCEYKPGKRKSCQFCRYQRCLNAGMSKDAIKTGRYTYLKRTEDTQEIKRLEDRGHQIPADEQDLDMMIVSSSLKILSPKKFETADFTRTGCHSEMSMEVDSTTSGAESDLSCSNSNFTSPNTYKFNKSLISLSRSQDFCEISSKNGRLSSHSQSSTTEHLSNQSELSDCCHTIYTDQSLSCFPSSPNSYSGQSDSFTFLYNSTPEVEVRTNTDFNPASESHSIIEVCDENYHDGRSVISNLLSNAKMGNITNTSLKIPSDSVIFYKKKENDSLSAALMAERNESSLSADSTVSERHICLHESNEYMSPILNMKCCSRTNSKDLMGPTFDLFPDISFCLDGQPISSPASLLSDDVGSTSVLTSSGPLSSMTPQSCESSYVSPPPSPGVIMLNMDSGKRLKISDESELVADLCHTPESRFPTGDENFSQTEDNITLQIMEEYTKGLDLIIDSPIHIQSPTPVQTLLTSPSPQDLKPLSPLPVSGSEIQCLPASSPTSKLLNSVKNLQISDISEFYSDKKSVTAMLMVSHKENIGDFNYMSKEEMTAQQKAHCESCQLKKQTFGELGFLPDQEYDDIYSVTGIDVDNRRMIIQKYLARMERCVRGLVLFAKTIPGFSMLDMHTQVELIKLARSEIAIFTVYPTVNMELGVTLGLTGESWVCPNDIDRVGYQLAIEDYMIFCDKLQKMAPTQEEEALLKAILVVSTDRDSSVSSPLAEAIRWQLILCLKQSLEKNHEQPALLLARYILALTQSRTIAEKFKDFFRHLKIPKYSSIEQNPLMWELFSGILQEKEKEENWDKLCQIIGEGKAGMWSPCLLGY